ncbi:hypothetical protein [Enterobacter hormaechei]|uniref:hypothetical protein n=2 Tax=Enterobacter hormaechei TaxID=158836 RepID=UPI0005EF241F|nr:hypothetical protein [Enterobacter hormaechei]KJP07828.1 hypothetical protein SS02_07820 [Enterobacter hormaechei subsp. steigerwaltii]
MRAFTNSECNMFLKAFGETVQTISETTFQGILETVPVSISTGTGGFIEGYEEYCTAKKVDTTHIVIGTVLVVRGVNNIVYNIVDDLSGMVDIYYRTEEGQSFAEDY